MCVLTKPGAHQANNGGEGEAISIEADEEEGDLEDLIIKEDEDEGMEGETKPAHPLTKLPAYIPPQKGKTKMPKYLDKSKSSLETLLLPDNIIFEGTNLGQFSSLKFED